MGMMRLGRKGAARRELFVAMWPSKSTQKTISSDRIWYMIAVDRDEDKGPTSCQTCDHNVTYAQRCGAAFYSI